MKTLLLFTALALSGCVLGPGVRSYPLWDYPHLRDSGLLGASDVPDCVPGAHGEHSPSGDGPFLIKQ
jgi:hypothetical protein